MAWAAIPPRGQVHDMEVHRAKLKLEQETIDPTLRWKLREQRLAEGLNEASAALVKQAQANAKAYQEVIDNAEKSTRQFYRNSYKEI